MGDPKITRQKMRKFTRAFAKILRFAGGSDRQESYLSFLDEALHRGGLYIIGFEVKGLRRLHMHSEHERDYGMGMEALVIGCTRKTNVITVWAWMLW